VDVGQSQDNAGARRSDLQLLEGLVQSANLLEVASATAFGLYLVARQASLFVDVQGLVDLALQGADTDFGDFVVGARLAQLVFLFQVVEASQNLVLLHQLAVMGVEFVQDAAGIGHEHLQDGIGLELHDAGLADAADRQRHEKEQNEHQADDADADRDAAR